MEPASAEEIQKIHFVDGGESADGSATDSPNSGEPLPSSNDGGQAPVTHGTLPETGVTLADLERIALANNPTLTQSQAAVTAEQGIYRQAGLFPNPQGGYLNGSASRSGVRQSNGAFYSQEVPTARKLRLAQNSASVEIQRYQWDNESQRRRVLNDLKIRYYEMLGAQEALAVTARIVQIAEHVEKLTKERWKKGDSGRIDNLQAQNHLRIVQLSHAEANDRYFAAWQQIGSMIGCTPIHPVPVLEKLDNEVPQLELEACWQNLVINSPQIRSTECDLGHAWAIYRQARADAYPNFTVQVVSEYDAAMQAAIVSSLVAMPVPIFNRNQGNIDKSAADILAAQAEISRVQLVLHDQLTDSLRRYNGRLRQSEALKTSILPNAEENLKLTQQLYDAGDINFAPVLAAQQAYFQNQMDYVESLTDLHKIVVEIQGFELTGGLNPAAIGSAIQNQPGGGAQRQRALLNETLDRNSKQLLPAAQLAQ